MLEPRLHATHNRTLVDYSERLLTFPSLAVLLISVTYMPTHTHMSRQNIFLSLHVTIHLSPCVQCSVYYKPEVIFMYSCNLAGTMQKIVP